MKAQPRHSEGTIWAQEVCTRNQRLAFEFIRFGLIKVPNI